MAVPQKFSNRKSTQRSKLEEAQPPRNQQIHRVFKRENVRFRAKVFRSGQGRASIAARQSFRI